MATMSKTLLAMLLGIMLLGGAGSCGCDRRSASDLPKLHKVGSFTLVNDEGKAFSSASLHNTVWMAHAMFTKCPSVCPLMTEDMRDVRKALRKHGNKVNFVSISVDPTEDKPAALKAYRKAHGGQGSNWHFLTGTPSAIIRVLQGELKLSVGQPIMVEGGIKDITHSSHAALVDKQGYVRGYYRLGSEGRNNMIRDATLLLETP